MEEILRPTEKDLVPGFQCIVIRPESGVRKLRFHDLRHTAATLMIDRGVDLVTVSKILGHKDMKTTMLYLHLLPNKIADTAALFSVTPRPKISPVFTPPQLAIV